MTVSYQSKAITADAALTLVTAAVAHAKSRGWEVCAAVCDPAGHLVAVLRTDRVVVPAIEFAIDKAYTAATLRTTTLAFHERAESKPPLKQGLTNRPRILVFPGGLPITDGEEVIGGIGVSGAADMEDVECAEMALEALARSHS